LLQSRPFFIFGLECLFLSNCVQQVSQLLRNALIVRAGHVRIYVHGQTRIAVAKTLLTYFHRRRQTVHEARVRVTKTVQSPALDTKRLEQRPQLSFHDDWYLDQNPGVPAGEVLVLSSRRQIGNGIRDGLNTIAQQKGRAWNAQSFYFEDALKTEPASDGFALLTMLVDPEDAPSLRFWLGDHTQDCRSAPYKRLRQHCEQSGLSPKAALRSIANGTLKIPYTGSLIPRFNELNARLAALAPLDIPGLIDALFPDGNPETASVRQTALVVAPTVATTK
jgi:hypothetical protein